MNSFDPILEDSFDYIEKHAARQGAEYILFKKEDIQYRYLFHTYHDRDLEYCTLQRFVITIQWTVISKLVRLRKPGTLRKGAYGLKKSLRILSMTEWHMHPEPEQCTLNDYSEFNTGR